MKKLVFLSGAGVSVDSGIGTFRGSGGFWEEYDVMDVASIEGWRRNPQLVQQFYNDRRTQLTRVKPNDAHLMIAELEKEYEVVVITQNVDDLHERAGSTHVIHLHGELTKACNESKTRVYDIGTRAIRPGEKAEDGSFLRPFIVWFGEEVPLIDKAVEHVAKADIFVVIGTSMQVYPAAGLIHYVRKDVPIYLIDPSEVHLEANINLIIERAIPGLKILKGRLAC